MNRLKQLRISHNFSQKDLASILFVNQTAVSQWERGATSPSPNILLKLCDLFGVTSDYLLERKANATSENSTRHLIPVLGNVQAGIPIEAIEDIIDYEEIDAATAAKGDYFALQIHGQSMEPKFSEGDVVIVKKQEFAESGDIVIALVNGDEATIKKLQKNSHGIMLLPSNPRFETLYYTNREIAEKPVRIIGKVVELRAKF